MQFTLVYQGDLPPTARAAEKHRIRLEISPQMERLWKNPPFSDLSQYIDPCHPEPTSYIGKKIGPVHYIPCISKALHMRAELHVRLLSSSKPGSLLQAGDIDNRLKTLLDALSIPDDQQAKPGENMDEGEQIFCLLENDELVTRIDITNDRLLTVENHSKHCLAVIEVHPVASRVTMDNMSIAV